MHPALRIAKKVFYGILICIVLLGGTVFAILRFYEEEVVSIALEQVGNRLNTRAHIDKAELRYWKTFPYVSVHFTNITIHSPETFAEPDTLFYAKSLYLGFSIRDLFSGHYAIRNVRVEEGVCHLAINKSGNVNWKIWRSDESESAPPMNVALEDIRLRQTILTYRSEPAKTGGSMAIDQSRLKLTISPERFDISANCIGTLKSLYAEQGIDIADRRIDLDSDLSVERPTGVLHFSDGKLGLDQVSLTFSGMLKPGDHHSADFIFSGKNIRLEHALAALPAERRTAFDAYDPGGRIDISGTYKRAEHKKAKAIFGAELIVRDGNLKHRTTGAALRGIEADLAFNGDLQTNELHIRSLVASMGDGNARVSGTVTNLNEPHLDLMVDTDLKLADVRDLLVWDTLEACDGNLSIRASVKGRVDGHRQDQKALWKSLAIGGQAKLTGGVIKLKKSNRKFRDISGTLLFNGTSASVQNLKGWVNGSDFELNGTASNLLPYLLTPDEKMYVDASLKCELLDFNQLTEMQSSGSDENLLSLPAQINLHLRTSIRTFKFKTFVANDIIGVTELHNGMLSVNPVSLRTADGEMMARISLRPGSGGNFQMESTASLSGINIRKFFIAFDNFGQQFLTDRHLKGTARADIVFQSPLSANMRLNQNSIFSLIDLHIENGELIALEPLQEVAKYIGENKWLAPFVNEKRFAEKLSHIRFSTLENTIRIENGVIHVPRMQIQSNVMDISVAGTHGFDSRIEYTIGFRLRDILVHKDREWEEADDGLGRQMFVYMRGTTSTPEFGIDRDAAKKNKKEVIAEEVHQVKSLLRQELGLFKKSGSRDAATGNIPVSSGAKTTVEWGESSTPSDHPEQEEKPVSTKGENQVKASEKPAKKVPKWLQEKNEYEKN